MAGPVQVFKLISFLLLFILVLGCKTQKVLVNQKENLLAYSKEEIYNNIFHQDSIDWFSAKAKIKIKDNSGSQKALMYLRMKSDSVVWIVFKKLSVEAARALITEDSIFIIYRLEKEYQASHLDSLNTVFGFSSDFKFLQNFILGRIPKVDSTRLWKEKETEDKFEFRSILNDLILDFVYNKRNGLLSSGKFYDRFNLNGSWQYSDYRKVQNHNMPFLRKFHLNFDDEKYLDLEIKFLEIDIGKSYNLKFDIPDHYFKIR